jgi:hypothetical protein
MYGSKQARGEEIHASNANDVKKHKKIWILQTFFVSLRNKTIKVILNLNYGKTKIRWIHQPIQPWW